MFDFSQYAEFKNVAQTVEAAGEGGSSGILPPMTQCVLVITALHQRSNDYGFKGVAFDLFVEDGGSSPQNKGLSCNQLFTIENPTKEKNAEIGRADIARIVQAVGMQSLSSDGSALIGKRFMCNVVHAASGNPEKPFVNLKMIKPVGTTQPAQGFSAPQQGFTAPQAQQQPFAPQQQQANPFPQQGGMPPFAMQQ